MYVNYQHLGTVCGLNHIAVRAAGGRTPYISLPPSRHSADENAEENAAIFETTSRDPVKIKKKVHR
jgi:hypothetical protein